MLAPGFQKYPNNVLTCSGPEVTNQTGDYDGECHKVQPERPEVLWTHPVTLEPCAHIGAGRTYRNRPGMPIKLSISWKKRNLHTK